MLQWLFDLSTASPIAYAIGLLTLVCAIGMAIGNIKYHGIGLGSAGVLFVGILVAHLSDPIDTETLSFVREFGLVLFVFTIGLQLGPGFISSVRAGGIRLNVLAASLVLLAGGLTPLIGWMMGIEPEAVAGLFAGASTNTPALGAVQQSLASLPGMTPETLALPALACAVSYPAAIAGVLGTLVLLKVLFRIQPEEEAREYENQQRGTIVPIVRRNLKVENNAVAGMTIEEIGRRIGEGVVISRILPAHGSDVQTALHRTRLGVGDRVLAVGSTQRLDELERLIGIKCDEDLLAAAGKITFRKIAVTHRRVLGKTLTELGLENTYGVEVTRVIRGDVEMTSVPSLRLHFGDWLQIVGSAEQLDKVAQHLGNSVKKLNETAFIPLFAGIWLGILAGSLPLVVPGLPHPLRLGLAGGPLLVALVLGRLGHLGGLVWHMPINVNHAFRELGVALFFAALGLAAGDQFFEVALSPRGMLWLTTGLVVTVIPLLVIGIGARVLLKMNFVTLGGLFAGAMTNPPALAFVNNVCRSESPTLAYATVYPLTTLLRILVAQLLALLLCG